MVLVDTNRGWGERTRDMIEAEGGEAIVVEADVPDPVQCAAIVQRAQEAFGMTGVILPVDAGTTATTTLGGSPYGRQ